MKRGELDRYTMGAKQGRQRCSRTNEGRTSFTASTTNFLFPSEGFDERSAAATALGYNPTALEIER